MKPIAPPEISADTRSAVQELDALTRFSGPPKEFWPRYLKAVGELTCAERTLLYIQRTSASAPPAGGNGNGEEQPWRRVGDWRLSSNNLFEFIARQTDEKVTEIAAACDRDAAGCGCIITTGEWDTQLSARFPSMDVTAIAVQPTLASTTEACVIVALIENIDGASAAEMLVRLRLASDVPGNYQAGAARRQSGNQVERLATALDLSVVVNEKERFYACALAFCNAIAAQLKCDRVSLGWMEQGFIRLQSISRMEKFERTMEAAGALEAAMDEAFDQDEEITWPPAEKDPEGARDATACITKDHEQYARRQGISHLMSIPLRLGEEPVGVITCERDGDAFTHVEMQQMRLACDVASRRLADLKKRDRWFGARAAASLKEFIAGFLGPGHTWAKVSAILAAVVLVVLIFWKVDYRTEANFILRSDEVAYVTAPFDGFIDQVQVRSGDEVSKGSPILSLDRTDLELRRTAAAADIIRNRREMDKARAAGDLAQRGISEALAGQAQATLDLIDLHLSQTSITTPYDAIVVEGDQRERQGAPVKQGEVLFKLARTDSLYVEAKLDERDIHEILDTETGEIAFVSQPKFSFPVRIEQIVPAAIPGDKGNVFLVRCRLEGEPVGWLRPGMSGVCKLNVGKRSLGWVLTHRTTDFLRMYFWW